MQKWLVENQQPSDQQELGKLFSIIGYGGREDESRERHRVCAGQPSASTATDTDTSFVTRSIIKS